MEVSLVSYKIYKTFRIFTELSVVSWNIYGTFRMYTELSGVSYKIYETANSFVYNIQNLQKAYRTTTGSV